MAVDLPASSASFLLALERAPDAPRARPSMAARGLAHSTVAFKYSRRERWAEWPFSPRVEAEEVESVEGYKLLPPAQMGPPTREKINELESRRLAIEWKRVEVLAALCNATLLPMVCCARTASAVSPVSMLASVPAAGHTHCAHHRAGTSSHSCAKIAIA